MNSALNLYKSSVKVVKITVPDVPDSLTITKAYLMVKSNWTDPDNNAVVNLSITGSATASGQITDSGADGTGTLQFTFGAATLNSITDFKRTYYTTVKVILSNGSAYLLPNSLMPTKIHAAAISATS
jgi:hypothetical protein